MSKYYVYKVNDDFEGESWDEAIANDECLIVAVIEANNADVALDVAYDNGFGNADWYGMSSTEDFDYADDVVYLKQDPHWIEKLIKKYGIKNRYKLAQLGGPGESTTGNMIDRDTQFENISLLTLHNIILAIQTKNPELDYNELLEEIWSTYMLE